MVIQETLKDALKYVKQMQERINLLTSSFDRFGIPQKTIQEIGDKHKQILSFIQFCNQTLSKATSYEAPQDWRAQKHYLDGLYKDLADKISIAVGYAKSIQNTRK